MSYLRGIVVRNCFGVSMASKVAKEMDFLPFLIYHVAGFSIRSTSSEYVKVLSVSERWASTRSSSGGRLSPSCLRKMRRIAGCSLRSCCILKVVSDGGNDIYFGSSATT